MIRIRLLQTHELEPDIAADCLQFEAVTGDSSGWRALAHRPDLLRLLRSFCTPLQFEGLLSRKLIEQVIGLTHFALLGGPQCSRGVHLQLGAHPGLARFTPTPSFTAPCVLIGWATLSVSTR